MPQDPIDGADPATSRVRIVIRMSLVRDSDSEELGRVGFANPAARAGANDPALVSRRIGDQIGHLTRQDSPRPRRPYARNAGSLGLGLVTLASLAVLAHAQDSAPGAVTPVTPDNGAVNVQLGGGPPGGSLREQIEGAFALASGAPPPHDTAPEWQLSPAIEIQQEWTDNAFQTNTNKQSSFITVVTPSISLNGSTSRLTASVFYAPSLYYYESVSGQSRVGQNLDAQALLTLVPDTLFLDLRGFAAQQSLFGANGPIGTVALASENDIQTYSFSATPYLTHRFGGWGTAELGVSDSETSEGLFTGNLPDGTDNENINTRKEFLTFASGENFGRWMSNATLSATQSSGTGALNGAYRDIVNYQAGYVINHYVTALASIGWEDIQYADPDPLHISDITWSVGAKVTPNPDSSITVLYGHQDGVSAAQVNATYAFTERLRMYADYSEGISTDSEQLQNALATAQLDAYGNPVNEVTGAPLLLTDNFFGFNSAVYKVRSADATLSWLLDRDAVQLTVDYQKQTPIGPGAFSSGGVDSDGTYGSVAWQHDVNPSVSTNLYLQYGKLSQTFPTGSTNTDLIVVSAAVNWRITPSLTGSLQYSYSSDALGSSQTGTASNLVVAGLRKTF